MSNTDASLAVTLLGLSLRYCATEIRQRVTRYKQLILVSVLLLFPGLREFNALVLSPLSGIFAEPESGSGARAAVVFVIIGMLWAGLHRDAISYPPAAALVASLPISRRKFAVRDLIVLMLVSSPLLVLVVTALLVSRPSRPGPEVLVLLDVILAMAAAQLAVIRKAAIWVPVAIITVAIAAKVHRVDVLIMVALVNVLLLWKMPMSPPWKAGDYRQARFIARFRRGAIGWRELHWRSVYQSTQGAYRLCLVVSIALTALMSATLFRPNSTPVYDLVVLLVHGAFVSGIFGLSFPTVFKNQASFQVFLNALPVSRFRRAIDIIVAVECPAVMLVALLGLEVSCFASGWEIAAIAGGVSVALCGAQYVFYRCLPRHAIVLGLVMSITIITLVLNLVSSKGMF